MPTDNDNQKNRLSLRFNPEINITSLISIVGMLALFFGAYFNIQRHDSDIEDLKNKKVEVAVYNLSQKQVDELKAELTSIREEINIVRIEVAKVGILKSKAAE